jgi:hypothetical protein
VRDVWEERYYDGYGRVVQTSIPYDVATGGGFGRGGAYLTAITYDIMGRVKRVTAPDGSYTENTYLDLEVSKRDARGNTTHTLMDVWGRTVQVIPPIGPGVSYTYDTLDRLHSATYGTALTSLSYDLAG